MKTVILPDELDLKTSMSIAVYDYESTTELSKQQVLLNKNTFTFLQEGSKEVYFNDASHAIDNSKFLLMKSGNCLMTEKLSNASAYYRSILFFFSNEKVLDLMSKFDFKKPKLNELYSTYCFDYDMFIRRFVESLLDISKLSKTAQIGLLNTKFEEIMLYLIELKGTNFLYSMVNDKSDQNQKFLQTIDSNKLNKLTIKELSFLCNMSVSTFKREFEKYFESSPSKWFQDKRLEHAAFLLKKKAKRPSDIFYEIGYENLSNFIQAFKMKFGVTPKQYQSN